MGSLRRDEAVARAAQLRVTSYDVSLDLTDAPRTDAATFGSVTRITLDAEPGATFLDVKPTALLRIALDGTDLDPDLLTDGRFPLDFTAGEHVVEVEARMPYRHDGEGLHHYTDPADGLTYLYAMSFMDAAPSVFACFDQPDLKAPYTLHVRAPHDWTVSANAPGEEIEPGVWEFAATQPLSTYFVTVVAGPYHVLRDEHDGIPLRLLSRRSLRGALDADAAELFAITANAFDVYHEMFGIRYPFGEYHQAFVPEFNAGAMENPGCVTLRDPILFDSRAIRSQRIQRACYLTHEMAHQWFGNIVTPAWWDDLWLNESFAEWAGNRVACVASPYADASEWASISRKNWGLTADRRPTTHSVAGNGSADAMTALQNFDGISYSKGAAVLRQLAARMGEDVFLAGVRDHIDGHRFGNATMHDLFDAWELAGARDLDDWIQGWLVTPGLDRLELDRERGELIRVPPADHPAAREHTLELAAWDGSAWRRTPVTVTAERTPVDVADRPVILDSSDIAWASLSLDDVSARALVELLPALQETDLRVTLWNTVRNAAGTARLDPATALDLVCAGLPSETLDVAVSELVLWAPQLVAVLGDRTAAEARLHAAFTTCGAAAPEDSLLRLSAFHGSVATSATPDELRAALAGDVPAGLTLDRELRWRIVRRLTQLDATDRGFLDVQLAAQRDAESVNDWSWCRAALADEDAKAWAWSRFRGEDDAGIYELETTGLGMWQPGQEELWSPYVDRYFAEVAEISKSRSGWALASISQFFYPVLAISRATVAATQRVCSLPDLDPGLRRRLADLADEVTDKVTARERYLA